MGNIMAVVAAFEIHMDRKAVGTINPSIILNKRIDFALFFIQKVLQ
jgi:hypothetical protein